MVEKAAEREHEMMFAPFCCPAENQACLILVYIFSLLINTLYISFFYSLWHFTASVNEGNFVGSNLNLPCYRSSSSFLFLSLKEDKPVPFPTVMF